MHALVFGRGEVVDDGEVANRVERKHVLEDDAALAREAEDETRAEREKAAPEDRGEEEGVEDDGDDEEEFRREPEIGEVGRVDLGEAETAATQCIRATFANDLRDIEIFYVLKNELSNNKMFYKLRTKDQNSTKIKA